MAIYEVTQTEVVRMCACCSRVDRLQKSDLTVGAAQGTTVDPNVIVLPECQCGAIEFLVRSPENDEHTTPGSFGHLHRLLVDALHAELAQGNRLAAGVDQVTARPVDPATLAQWFPKGLAIPLPGPKSEARG
jgi:hypothetical protein